MTTARELLDRGVRPLLNDPGDEYWPLRELLGYLNGGLQRLVDFFPAEFVTTATFSTAEGAKQQLPARGVAVTSVLANLDTSGNPGRAPHKTAWRFLGFGNPGWISATAAAPTVEWAPDGADPTVFWLSPPAPAGHEVLLEYVASPAPVDIDEELPVRQPRLEPLTEYVLYRAFSKDAEYTAQGGQADIHYRSFLQSLGVSGNGES